MAVAARLARTLVRPLATSANSSRNLLCKSILQDAHGVRLSWEDGHQSFFHSIWLRDHCPSDFHKSTGQRQVDTFSIPLDIIPKSCGVSSCNTKLLVSWEGGHVSSFPLQWLRENCYSDSERTARSKAKAHRILWDAQIVPTLPYYPFEGFLKDEEVFKSAVACLVRHGLLFFKGLPATAASTHAIADRIGCIRRTFYGDNVWDTKPKESKLNDTAFTNIELKPHTDCTYFHEPPALQFFNCAEQAAHGGSTWLVDGFQVARILKDVDPAAFEFFSTRLIPFHHASPEDNINMHVLSKVFELDAESNIERFRYNNDDRATLNNLPCEDVPLFYKHLHTLTAITRDPSLSAFVRLRPGDGVIVDNHRVMHGRQSFRGARNLLGWYMDRDDLESCARRAGVL